jgi:hypothetical protein
MDPKIENLIDMALADGKVTMNSQNLKGNNSLTALFLAQLSRNKK